MKILKSLVCLLAILSFSSTGFCLETLYNNGVGYNNNQGYDNNIPYEAFFNGHSPKPELLKVQEKVGKNVVQAEITVNQKEVEIKEQKGIE